MHGAPRFRLSLVLLTGLLIGVLLMTPFGKTCAAAGDRRVALLIGNTDYPKSPLKTPGNDVDLLAQTLEEMGFWVLKAKNLDLRTMKRMVLKFGQLIDLADLGLFYFAGQGAQYGGRNYLIPIGAQIDSELDLEFEALPLGRVLVEMRESKSPAKLVIVDAGYADPLGKGVKLEQSGLAQEKTLPGFLVAMTTAPGQVATPATGSVSDYAKELNQQIKKAGLNIGQAVQLATQSLAKKPGQAQTPWFSSALEGKHALAGGSTGGQNASSPSGDAAPTKTSGEIEQLLSQASQLVEQGRLDGSGGQSPAELYKKALSLDPQNQAAQAGLNRIVDLYADQAEEALAKKNLTAAWRSISAGEAVLPGSKRMAEVTAKFEKSLQPSVGGQSGGSGAAAGQSMANVPEDSQESAVMDGKFKPQDSQTASTPAQPAQPVIKPGQGEAPKGLDKGPVSLSSADLQKIALLLNQADGLLRAGRLTTPANQNAHDKYLEVLRIDPINQAAMEGLEKIVGQYVDLVNSRLKAGDRGRARTYLERAATVLPDDPRVVSLQKELQMGSMPPKQDLADQTGGGKSLSPELAAKKQKLFKQAEDLLAKGSHVLPKGSNAYEQFRQVLKLDPEDAAAKIGMERAIVAFSFQVESRILSKDYSMADFYLKQAEATIPDDPELLRLREKLDQQKGRGASGPAQTTEPDQTQASGNIKSLLGEADLMLSKGNYLEPRGKSAYDKYRQVLDLDPENEAAYQGLARIVVNLTVQAEAKIAAGDFDTADFYRKQAEIVTPGDPSLAELKQKIAKARQEAKLKPGPDNDPAKPIAHPIPNPKTDPEIERLLAQAEKYMTAGAFLRPRGKNAHTLYEQVLKLDKYNQKAREGIARIVGQYLDVVNLGIESKDYKMAGYYLQQAEKADAKDARIAPLKRQLAKLSNGEELEEPPQKGQSPAFGYSPDGRYFRDRNGVITDTRTGYQWAVGPNHATDYYEAQDWVENLKLAGGGWRLPTVNQLQQIHYPGGNPVKLSPIFPTSGWIIWSSEKSGSDDVYYDHPPYRYDFKMSIRDNADKNAKGPERVFAVRPMPSNYQSLPARTRANTVNITAAPAQTQAARKVKKAPTTRVAKSGRFTRGPDGVISDTSTGLQWLPGPDKEIDYYEAQSWIESIHNRAGGGWHMATVQDLETIAQRGVGDNNLDPIFGLSGWLVWTGQAAGPMDSSYYDSDPWMYDFRAMMRFMASRNSKGPERVLAVRRAR